MRSIARPGLKVDLAREVAAHDEADAAPAPVRGVEEGLRGGGQRLVAGEGREAGRAEVEAEEDG